MSQYLKGNTIVSIYVYKETKKENVGQGREGRKRKERERKTKDRRG